MKKIEVEIFDVPEKTLYLHQHLGDGTLGKFKFDASTIIPSSSILVTVEKKRYMVKSQDIIKAIIQYHEKNI